MQRTTDPISREVIKNALLSAADTMALTVVRTARSAVIKHAMDFSTALFTADGQQVAQGLTIPVHLGAMAPALEGVMNAFGDDVQPGDLFANNDPYEGGSHLPDIFLFKPVFSGDTLVGWSCAIGHQTDIGGRVPAGNATDSTEIYQEGIQIPPIKLMEGGVLNRAVWRILEKNVRVSEKVMGDIQALMAATRFGERDLLKLVDDYGVEEIKLYMNDILDTTEILARADIAKLPKGEWEFTDYLDNDGLDLQPIAIHAKLKIEGDEVFVDFEGTSPQARGSINPNFAFTKSMVYAAVKCVIDRDIESNSGFFRAFHITAPEGCFVNPQHPAPVSARGMSGLRISQTIFGALAKAMPDKVPGIWGGGEVGLSFGGYDSNRKGWVYLEFNNDGPRGGGPFQDGPDGLPSPVSNTANTPIESVEADHPLIVEKFELVPDSGGPGKYRGGLAYTREIRVLADEATFHLRSDRHDFPTWGVEGGKPGTPIENYINRDTNPDQIPPKLLTTLKKEDAYLLIQAGAGGYGDPLERELDSILDDVEQEKLTVGHVRREYGVVVDPDTLEIDLRATEELRASMRASRGG